MASPDAERVSQWVGIRERVRARGLEDRKEDGVCLKRDVADTRDLRRQHETAERHATRRVSAVGRIRGLERSSTNAQLRGNTDT